ncbi:MAG: B12-binding domain-containing protein [Planctomycetaceae bacterium]
MQQPLSPKQVAQAIGVSESSLKRWCDQGLIPFHRTAGGHRRLDMPDVVAFLRSTGHSLVRPELLGLPPATGQTDISAARVQDEFLAALVKGDEEVCSRIVSDLLIAGQELASICDRVIAAAFRDVGDRWDCGEVDIWEERRACEVSLQVLREVRSLVPVPEFDAAIAMGATLDGDPYTICSTMAELVLREVGFRTSALGSQLPFATLHQAVRKARPALFWLSVSSIRDIEAFIFEWNSFFETCRACETALVVGGRALADEEVRSRIRYCCYCDKMIDLAKYGSTIIERVRRTGH